MRQLIFICHEPELIQNLARGPSVRALPRLSPANRLQQLKLRAGISQQDGQFSRPTVTAPWRAKMQHLQNRWQGEPRSGRSETPAAFLRTVLLSAESARRNNAQKAFAATICMFIGPENSSFISPQFTTIESGRGRLVNHINTIAGAWESAGRWCHLHKVLHPIHLFDCQAHNGISSLPDLLFIAKASPNMD